MSDLTVIYKILADISGLEDGVKRAAKSAEGLEALAGRIGSALKTAFTVGALAKLSHDVIAFSSTLSDLSASTGISTTSLQRLGGAFEASGVSLETVATNALKLQKALSDPKAVKVLEQLGFTVKELRQMAPDQLLIAVGDALGTIANKSDQATAAGLLFGKGYTELLKGLDGHLKETTERFESMGLVIDEETVKALDDFGDQLGFVGREIIVLASKAIGPLLPMLARLTEAFMGVADIVGKVVAFSLKGLYEAILFTASAIDGFFATMLEGIAKIPILGKHLGIAADAAKWFREDAKKADEALAKLVGTAPKVDIELKKVTAATGKFAEANEEAEKALKKFNETLAEVVAAGRPAIETITRLDGRVVEGIKYYLQRGVEVGKLATIYGVLESEVKAVAEQMKFEEAAAEATSKAFGRHFAAVGLLNTRYSDLHETITGVEDATGDLVSRQIDLGHGMGTVIDSAGEAAKKTEQLQKALADINAMPSIGTQIATGLQDIAKNFGNVLVQGLTGGGGLVGALKGIASQIGGTLTGALSGTISKAIGGTLGSTIGGILGPLGSLAGSLVGGLFDKLFGNKQKEITNQIRQQNEALIQLHGGLEQLAAKAKAAGTTLDGVFNTTNPEQYKKAVDALNAALEFQTSAMATLDDTVKKYGFSIEELGPAFQRQQLDKQAQGLYQDFQVLIAGGIDVETVIGKMSEAINGFVQDAIKTGTEVPAAMKPMLQRMIDMGKLVDENGKAYESLEETGISFAETMTQGFNRLIDTVDKLTKAIARGLGVAIDDLPASKDIDINVNTNINGPALPEAPVGLASGGLVTRSGIRAWEPQGSDVVPAMLTPGEVVLTHAQQLNLASALSLPSAGASRPPVVLQEALTLQLEVQAIDSRDMAEAVEKQILPLIVSEMEDRRRGYAGRLARTLQEAGAA